ncbi:L-threonylcarbamoyladenylate synthase [Chitinispirillales bacterium ANBcel5]|uniref:L-threonylcarbamoyladenylate synthase n=1 Tax=Cellulosispirillum alkaliphilum TaxID=3039283 RepID=UPI002A570BD9|nr:L-threonylcarbamoyladenylate synthase [Chitinispirillales bacterium ANBcel5]
MTDEIIRAAKILKQGGLVAFPTETVYGLGACGFDKNAVARIFEVKKRPHFDPLILHIDDTKWLEKIASHVPSKARELTETFWPGPLTIVLPKLPVVPDIVTAGLPSTAVRMPANDIALGLIKKACCPIAAPSANTFGRISPTRAVHVKEQLGKNIETIIDGGPCSVGIESTIVSFTTNTPMLLRPGGLEKEEIEKIIGPLIVPQKEKLSSLSPGRCEQHYSPVTPLLLCTSTEEISKEQKSGLLSFTPIDREKVPSNVVSTEILSSKGDLREAACNLFAAMRRLDSLGLDIIYALPIPSTGLGMAINDRLSRASAKRAAQKLNA